MLRFAARHMPDFLFLDAISAHTQRRLRSRHRRQKCIVRFDSYATTSHTLLALFIKRHGFMREVVLRTTNWLHSWLTCAPEMKYSTRIALALALLLTHTLAHAASAIASSKTANGIAYYWCTDKKTVGEAKSCAVTSCREGAASDGASADGCRPFASDPRKGWWAIYHGDDGNIAAAFAPDRQQAIDTAYQRCAKDDLQCPDTAADVFSDGHLRAPAPRVTRWATRCNNASCVRTYDDGRRVAFTACINPSTGLAFDNIDGSCSGVDMSGHLMGM
ncbi:hypothetical protein [Paraburkholderia hospita]|uniref:hypothetical protein n=1 Tax=Paraburkholderia hospita TaxID=169430 RepID=UPI0002716191|nr:hypothetical protein [Paraburkholderia hospita]EUC15016.1 hypothetical protein PMI06_006192 [Burkholderia sp. BT03]SKC94370.1 hypothetical protein SAMN06266956_6248 [Paraburkholderia hospita]